MATRLPRLAVGDAVFPNPQGDYVFPIVGLTVAHRGTVYRMLTYLGADRTMTEEVTHHQLETSVAMGNARVLRMPAEGGNP